MSRMHRLLNYDIFDSEFKEIDWGANKVKLLKNKATKGEFYAIISLIELEAMRDHLIEWARQTKDLNSLDQRKQ